MTSHRLVAFAALVTLVPIAAHADDGSLRASKAHFERGEKLYALGKFADALDEYQKAYDAKPIPAFLFNIGQCHRGLGELDAAVFSYKKYLSAAPDAPNRAKVEALIDELNDQIAAEPAHRMGLDQPARTPEPPPTQAEPHGREAPHAAHAPVYRKWWFWTGVAVVGVAAGAGVYVAAHGNGAPGTDLGNISVPAP